jgi:arsenate reductase (thioredoxin)
MAEAILSRMGKGKIMAYSAGSTPKGRVHPLALELLESYSYSIKSFRSKSWDEFTLSHAPVLDIVITVCDRAANEICPVWRGNPITAHWGVVDPDKPGESMDIQRLWFKRVYLELENKFKLFMTLDFEGLDKIELQKRLNEIAKFDREINQDGTL